MHVDFQTATYSYSVKIPESVCKLIKTLYSKNSNRSSQGLKALVHDKVAGRASNTELCLPIALPLTGFHTRGVANQKGWGKGSRES